MKIADVTLCGFLSWCRETTISLEDLGRFVAISGRSGAGKSSVFEAITYCLYGKSMRGVPKTQLVNKSSDKKKGAFVAVTVDNGGVRYVVKRSVSGSNLEITADGKQVDFGPDNKTAQLFINDEVVGVDYDSFTKMVMISNVRMSTFFSMTPTDRRKFMDAMFDLGVMERARKLAVEKKNKASSKVYSIRSAISALENSASKGTEQADDEKEHADAIAKLVESKSKLEAVRDRLRSVKAKTEPLVRELREEKADIERHINGLKKRVELVEHLDTCPTCEQLVSEQHKAAVSENCASDIASAEKKLEVVIPKLEKAEKAYSSASDKLSEVLAKLQKVDGGIYRAEVAIEAIRQAKEKNLDAINEQLANEKKQLARTETACTILTEAANVLGDNGVRKVYYTSVVTLVYQICSDILNTMGLPVTVTVDGDGKDVFVVNGNEFKYSSFSDGEKSRLNLAMVFAWVEFLCSMAKVNPKTMFFDEITINLDTDSISYMLAYLMSRKDCQHVIISHSDVVVAAANNVIEVANSGGCSTYEVS